MTLSGSDIFPRLLEACPAAVVVADARGRVILLNDSAQRILRYGPREIKETLRVADLYQRRDDAREVAQRLRRRAPGVLPLDEPIDVELRASNGDVIPARLTVSFLRDRAGRSVATLGVFQDRREVEALNRRLADVSAEVEAVERRAAGIGLAAAASHRLAQPLTAALGQIEMLLSDDSFSPAATARLNRLMEQLDRMRRIVHEFTRSVTVHAPGHPERD